MGYIGMCHREGYGNQAIYSGIGYRNQRVWVQNRVSISKTQINWLKFRETQELKLKKIKLAI